MVEIRPGVWRLRITVPDEKRQVRQTVRGKREDAARELREFFNRVQSGDIHKNERLTVAALCRQWLDTRKIRVGSRTFTTYRQHVELWIIPTLDPRDARPARNLSEALIENAIAVWQKSSRHDSETGTISQRTVKHIFSTLRSILRWGVGKNKLTKDSTVGIERNRLKCDRKEMKTLSPAQIGVLLESAAVFYPEMTAPIAVAAGTGLRRGELLALRWTDANLTTSRLTVRRALEVLKGANGYTASEKAPKTPQSRRTVALAPFVVDILVAHREAQELLFEQLGMKNDPDGYVFTRADGNVWEPWTFSAYFAKLIARTKVPKVRFHDLRHSYASLSLEAGVDLKTVSASLGHSNLNVTADTYMHLGDRLKEEHAAKIGAIMGEALGAALRRKSRESHGRVLESRNPCEIRVSVVAPTGIEPVFPP